MSDHPLCKGCGQRMSVENEETRTHPQESCYVERIKRLERKVKDLRKENDRLSCLRWFAERFTVAEMEKLLGLTDLNARIWQLLDEGWLMFDWERNIVVHPNVVKAWRYYEKHCEED